MPVVELFSKRAKKARGEVLDVYQYTVIPGFLRNQIMMIMDEMSEKSDMVEDIVKILRKEYGKWQLVEGNFQEYWGHNYEEELYRFFQTEEDYEKCLDVIELFLRVLNYMEERKKIEEINYRMLEAGLGYEFSEGELIRIDDTLIHQEAVKPAIHFLNERGFEGAKEEFLGAFEDYRKKEYKGAILKSAMALESTLKSIFDLKNWEYDKRDTASKLVDIASRNRLIPTYLQNNMTNLVKQSVPVIRNKLASHGQGSELVEVPEEMVSYALHMTASTIVFLVKASKK